MGAGNPNNNGDRDENRNGEAMEHGQGDGGHHASTATSDQYVFLFLTCS